MSASTLERLVVRPTPVPDGSGGVLLGDRIWNSGAYRSSQGLLAIPGGNVPTRAFVCPADHLALVSGVAVVNTTAGTIVGAGYVMADANTAPGANDRFITITATAGEVAAGPVAVLDEGWSLWFSMASAGVTAVPVIGVIPKDGNDLLTPLMIKDVPVGVDNVLYTCPAGRAATAVMGYQHNRGAAPITYTSRVYRAADGATFVVGSRTQSVSGASSYVGGAGAGAGILLGGDTLSINPSAAGMNLNMLFAERDI